MQMSAAQQQPSHWRGRVRVAWCGGGCTTGKGREPEANAQHVTASQQGEEENMKTKSRRKKEKKLQTVIFQRPERVQQPRNVRL